MLGIVGGSGCKGAVRLPPHGPPLLLDLDLDLDPPNSIWLWIWIESGSEQLDPLECCGCSQEIKGGYDGGALGFCPHLHIS
jgi:hypothetical protein